MSAFRLTLIAGQLLLLLLWTPCRAAEVPAPPPAAGGEASDSLVWRVLEPGLELGLAVRSKNEPSGSKAVFVALRVDPARHSFSLCMASQSGKALSMAGWSGQAHLRAGINAGMYLPDGLTNTGYMRSGAFVNNPKVGARLGAFFMAGPRSPRLPPADIADKESPAWEKGLEEYEIVVQNYRLTKGGQLLWPKGREAHSIAAIAKDKAGRMLFLLSQEPLTVQDFVHRLDELSLDAAKLMYVEGGRQAGLFLRLEAEPEHALPGAFAHPASGGIIYVWKGRQSLLNIPGNPEAPLPNIIGVKIQ